MDKIHLKSVKRSIADVIDDVKQAKSLSQIKNIKKMKGFTSSYRIRIGDYRIGIFVEGDIVEFARVLNRREIYRYFP